MEPFYTPLPETGFGRQFVGGAAQNLYRYLDLLDRIIPGNMVPDIEQERWDRWIGVPESGLARVGRVAGAIGSEIPLMFTGAGLTRAALT